MGERGNLKNRLRICFLNLKRNKKNKEKKEKYRIKKTFAISFVMFFGLIKSFFGKVENKKKDISLEEIELRIKNIENKIIITTDVVTINKLKEELFENKKILADIKKNNDRRDVIKRHETKKTINKINSNEVVTNAVKLIDKILEVEKKIEDKKQNLINAQEQKIKSKDVDGETINNKIQDKFETKSKIIIENSIYLHTIKEVLKIDQDSKLEVLKSDDQYHKITTKKAGSKSNLKKASMLYIKKTEEKVTKIKKNLEQIKNAIGKNNDYSTLEYELYIVSLKIKQLEEEYKEFSSSQYFYKIKEDFDILVFDKKNILKQQHIRELNKKYDDLKETLKKAREKDMINSNSKKVDKKENDNKKRQANISDEIIFNKIIEENIKKQQKEIESLLDKVSPQERKKSIFTIISNTMSKCLKFLGGISVFFLFKNIKLTSIIGLFVTNNYLRSITNIFSKPEEKENYINFNEIKNIINNEQSLIHKTLKICDDSLDRIDKIKQFINSDYAIDNEIHEKINNLEKKIINQKQKILYMNEELVAMQTKMDEKVKKLKL